MTTQRPNRRVSFREVDQVKSFWGTQPVHEGSSCLRSQCPGVHVQPQSILRRARTTSRLPHGRPPRPATGSPPCQRSPQGHPHQATQTQRPLQPGPPPRPATATAVNAKWWKSIVDPNPAITSKSYRLNNDKYPLGSTRFSTILRRDSGTGRTDYSEGVTNHKGTNNPSTSKSDHDVELNEDSDEELFHSSSDLSDGNSQAGDQNLDICSSSENEDERHPRSHTRALTPPQQPSKLPSRQGSTTTSLASNHSRTSSSSSSFNSQQSRPPADFRSTTQTHSPATGAAATTASKDTNSSPRHGGRIHLTAEQWAQACQLAEIVGKEHADYIRDNIDAVVDQQLGSKPLVFGDVYQIIKVNKSPDLNRLAQHVFRILSGVISGSERFLRNFAIVLTDMTSHGWCPINGHDILGAPGNNNQTTNMANGPIPSPYMPQSGPGYPNVVNPWGGTYQQQGMQGLNPAFGGMPQIAGGMLYSTQGPVTVHGMMPFQPYAPYQVQPFNPYGYHQPPPPTYSGGRALSQPPTSNPDMPAASLSNPTGGTGVEPGYNYFFVSEHVRIFVVKCKYPPWQINDNSQIAITANFVPGNVTVGELMRGFGCDNPEAKQNRVTEVVPGGSGNWYKGLSVTGGAKDLLKRTIREMGWDGTRGGTPATEESPGVYLWFCK